MDNKTEDNLKGAQIDNSDKVEEQKVFTFFTFLTLNCAVNCIVIGVSVFKIIIR